MAQPETNAGQVAAEPRQTSRYIYLLWAAGLTLLAVLAGLLVFVVKPCLEVRSALAVRDGTWSSEDAVKKLGGQGPAARKIALYARLPERWCSTDSEKLAGMAFHCAPDGTPFFIALLGSSRTHVRKFGARALSGSRDKRALGPLIAALKDSSPIVRVNAIQALEKLGDERAIGPLTESLRDPDSYVRQVAAETLGALRDYSRGSDEGSPAAPALLTALKDRDIEVRVAAVTALAELGDISAVDQMTALLNDPEPRMRLAALGALGRFSNRDFAPIKSPEASGLAWADSEQMKGMACLRAIGPVIAVLKDSDEGFRYAAVGALANFKSREAVEPVAEVMRKDSSPLVRLAAVEALGDSGDERAVDPLITALRDPDDSLRAAAARSLTKLASPRSVVPLIACLKDPDEGARIAAAEALARMPDKRAVEPLVVALRDPRSAVRARAARALGPIGDPSSATALITSLSDQDDEVRYGAAFALKFIPDKRAVDPLIACLAEPLFTVAGEAAGALGVIGDRRAVGPLIAALEHRDLYVRLCAVAALGQLKDARAVEPLMAVRSAPDATPELQADAYRAIYSIDPEKAKAIFAAEERKKPKGD